MLSSSLTYPNKDIHTAASYPQQENQRTPSIALRKLKALETHADDSLQSYDSKKILPPESATLNQEEKNPIKVPSSATSRRQLFISRYNQAIYKQASQIFAVLQHEPRDDGTYESALKRKAYKTRSQIVPYLQYTDEKERKLTFELAYSTLKYQYLLEDLLYDIGFFSKYPELEPDTGLVLTVLNDYLQRRFLNRDIPAEEITYREVEDVESCIIESKVKLDAALARRRIKDCARCIEDLLPLNLKSKEGFAQKPLTYAWINFNKTSAAEVINTLQHTGYSVLVEASHTVSGTYFCMDNIFDDTVVFSSEQSIELSSHSLVKQGHLVIQDKSSLFGPQAIVSLLNGAEDILIIDSNTGFTAAHLSSLMKQGNRTGTIYMSGVRSPDHQKVIQQNLDLVKADNVKILEGQIDLIAYDDVRIKNIKLVLLNAQCSKSAVLDPVGYVTTEGEDLLILQDLSSGKIQSDKVNESIRKSLAEFRYILKFPKVQAIVYITRSLLETENENIVSKAIESYNAEEQRRYPYRIVPPTLKFDTKVVEANRNDKYYRHPPSEQSNGCFLAVVTKQIEDVKENAQAVLQRANALGLLNDNKQDKLASESLEEITGKPASKAKKSSSRKSTASNKSRKSKKRLKPVAFGTSAPNITSKIVP